MLAKEIFSLVNLLFVVTALQVSAQSTHKLPRSTPEAEGVSSAGINSFLDAAAKGKTEFHSIMFLRHGKVIAEGWWNPYKADLTHSLYSTSKSFTAAAVGFALTEKKLSLDDKVISFFPNDVPATISPNLAALTVKDVLMMSDGQDPDPTSVIPPKDNWVKEFLATPVINKPGTKFLYNSMGTYMLSAIVTKVTGQKIIDYLTPRLFEPLGIKGEDWETSPQGANTGGWGLRLHTEDMAKFGQLYLQKGMWNGKQLLPKEWVEEATTMKIMQDPNAPQSKKDSSDWLQGYCYQMWRCRHDGVRADGAFGQYIIMLPGEDAVIAITAETPDMQEEINLVWQYLLPAMHDGALPADNDMAVKLKNRLAALALPPAAKTGVAKSFLFEKYNLQANEKNIKSISFVDMRDKDGKVVIEGDTAEYKFNVGNGKWLTSSTTMPGPYLVSFEKGFYKNMPPMKVAGSFDWKDEHTLELTLRYIESPHTAKMVCHFDGKNVTIDYYRSFEYGTKKVTLTGELAPVIGPVH